MNSNNEWYTPKYIIDMVYAVLGSIDTGPFANAHANSIVRTSTFFDIQNSKFSI